MMTTEHTYGGFGDFSLEGYGKMAEQYNAYIANFLATGDPNGEGLMQWDNWTPDNKVSLVLDANETEAIVEVKDVSTTYTDIIAAMEADTTIPADVKAAVIANVMNGRWFSEALDEYYQHENLWK